MKSGDSLGRRGGRRGGRRSGRWIGGRRAARGVVALLLAGLIAGACGGGGGEGDAETSGSIPLAPDSVRIDLAPPDFPTPTEITNPLFPVAGLTQVIQLGTEEDKPSRVEITVLAGTRGFDWSGKHVEARPVQFVSFLGGQIVESARDYYAQAADGSVWYFGEEVDNYRDGTVADHEGTWLAGADGPPGMIMPATPVVGAVYRSENIPGLVLEQDTVKAVNETLQGPRGPVPGAVLVEELLMDSSIENKAFAPGYGEFRAGAKDELVTLAVAAPTDARSTPMPDQLAALYAGAIAIFDAVPTNDWAGVSTSLDSMTGAWATLVGAGNLPPLLVAQTNQALAGLVAAVPGKKPLAVRDAGLDVAQAALDLQMQYRPVPEIDADRLLLWARRILVDVGRAEPAAVAGDVATIGWTWDRVRPTTVDGAKAAVVDGQLATLRDQASKRDFDGAVVTAQALLATLGR